MRSMALAVAREARAMTRQEVIVKAIDGRISWIQAGEILGITDRHMRRLKLRYQRFGFGGLRDMRGSIPRRKRISVNTIAELCRLRRERYADFSVRHFWQFVTERHALKISYTWALLVLQAAGLAEKAPARGKYRRRRERRPMTGMLLHLDASTHRWLADQPMADLVVVLDDADGRILYAQFVAEEGTASTFAALEHVLSHYGRFGALYTDRGTHFCRTSELGQGPDDVQRGQVTRALRALGIRQILARSPEARGRSERNFRTLQGRLPQELRVAAITSYAEANHYLETTFVPDFNQRFTERPAQRETAFVRLKGIDLRLVLSIQHDRTVGNDHTVQFRGLVLQLPPTRQRPSYARCPVTVHQFTDETLGVSHQGRLLARFNTDGELLAEPSNRRKAA